MAYQSQKLPTIKVRELHARRRIGVLQVAPFIPELSMGLIWILYESNAELVPEMYQQGNGTVKKNRRPWGGFPHRAMGGGAWRVAWGDARNRIRRGLGSVSGWTPSRGVGQYHAWMAWGSVALEDHAAQTVTSYRTLCEQAGCTLQNVTRAASRVPPVDTPLDNPY